MLWCTLPCCAAGYPALLLRMLWCTLPCCAAGYPALLLRLRSACKKRDLA